MISGAGLYGPCPEYVQTLVYGICEGLGGQF